MTILVQLEYPGLEAPGDRQPPGTFSRRIEGLDRVPTIGESIAFEDLFVGRVAWVLWRIDGRPPEVHVELQEGFRFPRRDALEQAGWEED